MGTTIKDKLAEFAEIIEYFDSEDLDVEQATEKFEEGAKLAEEIKAQLETAKNKITVLAEKFDK